MNDTPRDVRDRPADGLGLIYAERMRQMILEGFSAAHDAKHTDGELIAAAVGYLAAAAGNPADPPCIWPWTEEWWKPERENPTRALVKAGALIAAEIDRRHMATGRV